MLKLKDVFDVDWNGSRKERTCNLTLRLFGIDFDVALYGFLDNWVFPFMFVPTLRGFFLQSLFVAVFIGRLKDQ